MSAENSIETAKNLVCVRCRGAISRKDLSDAFFRCDGRYLINVLGVKLFFRKHPPYLLSSKFVFSLDRKLNRTGPNDKIDGNLHP